MKNQIPKHNRQSHRLQGYDYAQAGLYFITICVYNRECLFGKVIDCKMKLNNFGQIVYDEWYKSAAIRPNIELGEFIVMPNHIHGIIAIVSQSETSRIVPIDKNGRVNVAPNSLGAIVRGFKSAVTKRINEARQSPAESVWQSNYHDHIIRNIDDHARIADYIVNNPSKWAEDRFFL